MKRTLPLLALLVLGLFLAPGALAHASYTTDDGAYRITVGYQGEPVYTYQATGLDLIIRDNATGSGIEGVHETLEATLISPSGAELTYALEPQHGETSRYTFAEGFVLTEPGLYKLRLVGTINDTAVDGEYAMAHATSPRTQIMFPASGLSDIQALNERIADLESQVAGLELQIQALQADGGTSGGADNAEAPAAGIPLVLAGALLVAFLARRR